MNIMMKKLSLAFIAVVLFASCAQNTGVIKVETPSRPAGQESVLGLKTEPIETVRVGIIGLGMRGYSAVDRLTYVPDCRVAAICDIEQDRVDRSAALLQARGVENVAAFGGEADSWRGLCESPEVDLVYICTDWKTHVPMALYAMECGKHVAIEVPAATTLDDIWALIDMSEKTRRHCMMLENCVYDFFEMSTLAMAQEGVFGEVLHVEGAYHHCLDPFWDEYWESWRLEFNKENRGDVYPTHGIGPVCQVLDIHRGDRMKTLVSMDTKPVNGPKIYELKNGVPCPEFRNADQTSTLIRTENGKTMLIQHDVMTPRPYEGRFANGRSDNICRKHNDCEHSRKYDTDFSKKFAFSIDFVNCRLLKPHHFLANKCLQHEYLIHTECEKKCNDNKQGAKQNPRVYCKSVISIKIFNVNNRYRQTES